MSVFFLASMTLIWNKKEAAVVREVVHVSITKKLTGQLSFWEPQPQVWREAPRQTCYHSKQQKHNYNQTCCRIFYPKCFWYLDLSVVRLIFPFMLSYRALISLIRLMETLWVSFGWHVCKCVHLLCTMWGFSMKHIKVTERIHECKLGLQQKIHFSFSENPFSPPGRSPAPQT